MTLRLALRTFASRPVRSAVLSCGFGFGIAVMAALLGVGEVILEQAGAPALVGGGDVRISSASGDVGSARFLMSSLRASPSLGERVAGVAASKRATLYLVESGGTTPVIARGGIPSLERSIGDPETSEAAGWVDTPADLRWSSPDPADILRAMDRFHPIPDVPARAGAWAEWLYFNGRSRDGAVRFYLTFLVGPRAGAGKRAAGVRLQLERAGRVATYSRRAEIEERELFLKAPDIELGGSRVRLEGLRYRIHLELDGLTGEIVLDGVPGRSLPPFSIRGAGGWVSGYTVPVLSGPLDGSLVAGAETIPLDGATGYHDHNWGFWEGVTWQWGQVASGDLSFVYGRIRPPPDAADPERIPGFLAVLGPKGPLGFSTDVTIDETNRSGTSPGSGDLAPRSILVRARGADLELEMQARIEEAIRTPTQGPFAGREGAAGSFFQLRALYRVAGRVGDRTFEFTAHGAAETFRGQGS